MNTIRILNYIFVAALGFFTLMFGIERFSNKAPEKETDTIYTYGYCDDITGFNDVIPLEINMENGKIANIVILENRETPRFMQRVVDAALVENFYGLTPKEAIKKNVDAVSGATYSSNAIIKSVKTRMSAYCNAVNPNPWTWQLFGIIGCAVVLVLLGFLKKRSF